MKFAKRLSDVCESTQHVCELTVGETTRWRNDQLPKDALSDDRDDSRLLMPAGMFFVVIGGWLLSR